MNGSLTFGRAVARTAFIILLLYVLAAPQLTAESPGSVFAGLRDLLKSTPATTWLLIIAVILFGLWIGTTAMRLRAASLAGGQQLQRLPAASLPISEAVNPANGGNGLASAPFAPLLPWLGIAGWAEIKEPDKECLVIDTQRVVRHTQMHVAPMRLLGKPVTARRVLMSPAPLNDLSAKALTSDQLELTLVVSVKYAVADPAYVASLQAPLSELNNLITGVVSEYIHSATLENIVSDDGTLRRQLKQRMEQSPTIQSRYNIIEILKALPTGDERIIEVIRQTREALQKRALIEQEGQNKVLTADYDLTAERAKAELRDEFEQRQHAREMDMNRMLQEFEVQRELVRTIAAIAASGINPAAAIQEIRALMLGQKREPAQALPQQTVITEDLIGIERKGLEQIRSTLGIKQFDIQPYADHPGQPGSAQLDFDGFTILIECPSDYPRSTPTVRLQLSRGDASAIPVPWREGSNLVDATTAAVMQARVMADSQTE